jgi:hypothetical protein
MGWLSTCSHCGELTRYACDRHDRKSDCDREILSCPLADRNDKLWAMERLGFDIDWIDD